MDSTEEIIFEPSERAMKDEYPELLDIQEFKSLSDEDLKIIWYYSNPTSPLVKSGVEDSERLSQSIALVYPKRIPESVKEKYKKGIHPSLSKATSVMSLMNARYRRRAKDVLETLFANLEKIIHLDENKIKDMSFSQRSVYCDMVKKISPELPNLIMLSERGFGVKKKGSKKQDTNTVDVTINDLDNA